MDGSKAGGWAIEGGGRNVCVLFDGHGPRHVTRLGYALHPWRLISATKVRVRQGQGERHGEGG